LLGPSPDLGA